MEEESRLKSRRTKRLFLKHDGEKILWTGSVDLGYTRPDLCSDEGKRIGQKEVSGVWQSEGPNFPADT